MRKAFAMLLMVVMLLTACTATPLESAQVESAAVVELASASSATVLLESSQSAEEALAENTSPHGAETDETYDLSEAVAITLNGDSISSDGSGVVVDGSTATITSAGTYSLSGSLTDGQIIVNTKAEALVRLVLNGADLRSTTSSPLYLEKAEEVIIILADGTENFIADGADYTFANAEENEPNAALFSKADLTIAGNGSLTVAGNYNDGIASKDGLLIAGGTITVSAVDDGIRGKDYLVVEGGSLSVEAQGDGLKADNAEDATKGYIDISGGAITVNAGGNALQAETDVIVTGGILSLTAGGGSGSYADADTSMKGIGVGANINIDGGAFTINAADDALNANGNIVINGGTFALATGDDGMHANTSLEINGGSIEISESYEGLESALITLNAGDIWVNANDDGINVAGGVDGSGMGMRPGGGQPGQDMFGAASANGYYLYIHGGTILVDAGGDGLDVNGAIEMTGGVVLVNGPTNDGNGALDYDAGFNLTGGFFAAAGSAGMAQAPGTNSSQNSVAIFFNGTQPGSTLVSIQNSAGEDLLTFVPTKQFQSLVFSSPDLASGQTYTILLDGSEYASFTADSVVTTLGTGGMGGGMRGGPGGGSRRP
ncbi:MAG: carbohydrate-binding domain-containing protein [Anaerolineaceae bacterium]|nr:carbohydrate-binding domain-containing protein [Anaerolineaceae bacterium]